ncbi:MAG: aldose epimerase family protein [Spirochaetaceae bacterium]
MRSVNRPFGTLPDGREAMLFTFRNGNGYELSVTNYGGIITSCKGPDREGNVDELTLAFDTLEEYLRGHPFYGSTVGRVANRIKGAGFTVHGSYYAISPCPSTQVHLHGGKNGFHTKLWQAEEVHPDRSSAGVELSLVSPDGDEGYPGELSVTVTISLSEDNRLEFRYRAESDKATPVNLTNHTYWNLAGGGKILDHWIRLYASTMVETDNLQLPTGRLLPVEGTPFDLRTITRIGERIGAVTRSAAKGFDDCYFIDGWESDGADENLVPAAELRDPKSGRVMEVATSYPGVQFYTGNNLPGQRDRQGRTLSGQEALCLETQFLPDSVHHPSFPNTILEPGTVYTHRTVHRFSTS